MPTITASTEARQRWASRRLCSPEIHFESPLRVATLPSSVIADLNSTHGRPTRACLRKAWFSSLRAGRQLAVGDHHLDALVAEDPEAAPGGLLGRVVGGDHDAADPGPQDRVGARRRLALVAAGLERDVEGRVREILQAAGLDRVDLGVHAAVFAVPALTQDLAVADHDGAHHGIRLDGAGAVARRARSPVRGRPCRCRCSSASHTEDNPRCAPAAGSGRRGRRAGGRRSSPAPAGGRRAGSSRSSSRSRT